MKIWILLFKMLPGCLIRSRHKIFNDFYLAIATHSLYAEEVQCWRARGNTGKL